MIRCQYVALVLFAIAYAVQHTLGGSGGAVAALVLFALGSVLILRRTAAS